MTLSDWDRHKHPLFNATSWVIFMGVLLGVLGLVILPFVLKYKINSERFPTSAKWTRFF